MPRVLVLDTWQGNELIQERKRRGLDHHDEVWEGMYVMPSMPSMEHQELVHDLDSIFDVMIKQPGLGKSYPGANVSDRRAGWEHNFRVPDVVVVLKSSRAVICSTHVIGGPDFLVEIESPGDDTEDKVPFYSTLGVHELLIIHRDKRKLRLLRLEGEDFIEVQPSSFEGKQWLVSEVMPLACRRVTSKGTPRTDVRRTDGEPGHWTI